MKKTLACIVLFTVCLLNNSQAQILEYISLKFGGVVAFQVNNNSPRLGISLGISKDIINWDKISLASELSYITKGYVTSLSERKSINNLVKLYM
ncbi:MAG: hypothetical protein KKG93_03360 [Bacteroidetes bacterium]|nr:hypothetical protein [Bacteroidota bacterium]